MYSWYFTCLFFGTLTISNIYLALLRWVGRKLFGEEAPAQGEEGRGASLPSDQRTRRRR